MQRYQQISSDHFMMTWKLKVNNGLCQGFTMAPTLFNLYACAVVEKWLQEQKLVHVCCTRWTDNYLEETPEEPLVTILLNVSLLMMWSSLLALERAINTNQSVARSLRLTVSLPKTKFMLSVLTSYKRKRNLLKWKVVQLIMLKASSTWAESQQMMVELILRLINTQPVYQELLVLSGRQYLKMIIYQLIPRGKYISNVCYLFYFMEENAGHL